MDRCGLPIGRLLALVATVASTAGMVSCGGGGGSVGNAQSAGLDKTFLSVSATDADGDALHYQWRVTSGTIDNKDSSKAVWTMPDGPGLHFAYVAISDGKGGWTEEQYSVSSDSLGTTAAVPAPVTRASPAVADVDGSMNRLRFSSSDATLFTPPAGGTAQARIVYLPGVQVQVVAQATGAVVFSGSTNLAGEVDLPKLPAGSSYNVMCSTQPDAPLAACGSLFSGSLAAVRTAQPALAAARNLRLFGHVALADGGVCGHATHLPTFSLRNPPQIPSRSAEPRGRLGKWTGHGRSRLLSVLYHGRGDGPVAGNDGDCQSLHPEV